MRSRGVDEATRRELMGHSTAVAHAIYAHGNEAAQMAALGAVAEIAQIALAD